MRIAILLAALSCVVKIDAQPNCNVFKWKGDSVRYQACLLMDKAGEFYQFDREAMIRYDSAIAICPDYANAHYEKAVVYLKAGNFKMWDKSINLAVKYDPLEYLSPRASCRGKSFGDYRGAINDINRLDSLTEYDLGYVHDAAYHLNAYKALCHKALGEYEIAISIFKDQIKRDSENPGLYDNLHLGVCYLKTKQYQNAIAAFDAQISWNVLAEAHYYKALCYLKIGDTKKHQIEMLRAKELLESDRKLNDPYQTMEDQIFIAQIFEQLAIHEQAE